MPTREEVAEWIKFKGRINNSMCYASNGDPEYARAALDLIQPDQTAYAEALRGALANIQHNDLGRTIAHTIASQALATPPPKLKLREVDVTIADSDLRPCPFCDCTKVLNWLSHDASPNVWCVFCEACEAEGPHAKTSDESLRLWNRACGVYDGEGMTDEEEMEREITDPPTLGEVAEEKFIEANFYIHSKAFCVAGNNWPDFTDDRLKWYWVRKMEDEIAAKGLWVPYETELRRSTLDDAGYGGIESVAPSLSLLLRATAAQRVAAALKVLPEGA